MTPLTPSIVGICDTPEAAFAVAVAGRYAYITDRGRTAALRIIDIADPTNPTETGLYEPLLGAPFDLAVAGNYAYVYDETYPYTLPTGLHIIDISDPANPTEVGFFEETVWGEAYDIDVEGDYAYVPSQSAKLHIVDITDPTNPTEVGSLDPPVGRASISVDVVGDYAYLGLSNFQIVDISDPANPNEVGNIEMPSHAWDVEVSGNVAYAAIGNGLQIVNVSDPASPPRLKTSSIRPARLMLRLMETTSMWEVPKTDLSYSVSLACRPCPTDPDSYPDRDPNQYTKQPLGGAWHLDAAGSYTISLRPAPGALPEQPFTLRVTLPDNVLHHDSVIAHPIHMPVMMKPS